MGRVAQSVLWSAMLACAACGDDGAGAPGSQGGTLLLSEVAELPSGIEVVTVCPSGDVFVSQFHSRVIWRLPVGGAPAETNATLAEGSHPVGLTCDGENRVFVARYLAGELTRCSDGQVLASSAIDPAFETPASLAFRGGTLFITRYNINEQVVGKLFALDLGICGGAP